MRRRTARAAEALHCLKAHGRRRCRPRPANCTCERDPREVRSSAHGGHARREEHWAANKGGIGTVPNARAAPPPPRQAAGAPHPLNVWGSQKGTFFGGSWRPTVRPRLSHWLLVESLHRLIKRSNLCSHRLVLATQFLDTRELVFDRMLPRA